MKSCACGNIAKYGSDTCGRCASAAEAEERAQDLRDAVRNAAMDIPEGPFSRFADAVVAWIDEQP